MSIIKATKEELEKAGLGQDEKAYLSHGVSNKVGKNLFYLTIDYDGEDIADVERDIKSLQQKFLLGDADIYKTTSGFHAYFFLDNQMSGEKLLEVLKASQFADQKFIATVEEGLKSDKGAILRVSGKYEKRDIFHTKHITGSRQKVSLFEKKFGESLRKTVDGLMTHPLFDATKFQINPSVYLEASTENTQKDDTAVSVENTGSEKEIALDEKTIDAVNIESEIGNRPTGGKKIVTPDAPKEIVDQPKENTNETSNESSEEVTVSEKLPKINDLWAQNREITELRREWYRGSLFAPVARLFSSSTEGREVALSVPKDFKKKTSDLFAVRAFFLSNSTSKETMLKPYNYVIDKTKFDEKPLNVFQSHAKMDLSLIDMVPLVGNEHKAWSEELLAHKSNYVNGFDIIFDIDSKETDKSVSYEQAKKMRNLLQDMGLPFILNFSGSKGFHVRIPADKINECAPEFVEYIKADKDNVTRIHKKMLEFANKSAIEVDPAAYSGGLSALIRVLWSVHWATGSVVKPLTDAEFDSLEGKKLGQICEMYRVDNLLKGNKMLGTKKLNLQPNEFIIKAPSGDGRFMSWEEMRDSGKFNTVTDGKTEWENIRSAFINPIMKDLRLLAKEDIKKLKNILEEGEYMDCKVEAPEWIDLVTGRNHDYCRKGNNEALREFALGLIK